MRLYQSTFSYEVDKETGGMSIVFPTVAHAHARTVELLRQEMQERIEGAEKYDCPLDEGDNLSAEISLVELPPINVQTICDIINSEGGRFVASLRPLLKFDLPAGSTRVHVTRQGKARLVGTSE